MAALGSRVAALRLIDAELFRTVTDAAKAGSSNEPRDSLTKESEAKTSAQDSTDPMSFTEVIGAKEPLLPEPALPDQGWIRKVFPYLCAHCVFVPGL